MDSSSSTSPSGPGAGSSDRPCTVPGSLWVFALDRYARPGAEPHCLSLQDAHGFDVCELLWVAWLAERGLEPPSDIVGALEPIRRWQREMTLPLRQRRRALKSRVAAEPSLEALRQSLKQAELEAERETLRRLEGIPGCDSDEMKDPTTCAVDACRCLPSGNVTPAADALLNDLMTLWVANARDAEPDRGC